MQISRRGFLGGLMALATVTAVRLRRAGRLLLTAAGLWEVPMVVPVEVAHGVIVPIPTATWSPTPTATATATATATLTATATATFTPTATDTDTPTMTPTPTNTPSPTPTPAYDVFLPLIEND